MPNEVRDRIVEAAGELYYRRGIQAVGMDEVRARSGVPLKRMYAEFASKDQLVAAVLAARHEAWVAGIEHAAPATLPPRDRLLAIFDFLDDWFCDDSFRGCAFINAFGELGASSPAVAESARRNKTWTQRFVARIVDDAGAAPDLAPQLSLLIEGAQTTAAISGSSAPAGHARRAASVLIDGGLRAA